MNKDYYREWGLYLPFRFYLNNRNKISEDSDYGRYINIPKSEFLLMPQGVILPFQVIREASPVTSYELFFYCLSGGEPIDVFADYPFLLTKMNTLSRAGFDHISFFGGNDDDGDILIPAGGYYAVFTDGTNEFYSESIKVLGEAEFEETATFRKWSINDDDIRTTGEDLRII